MTTRSIAPEPLRLRLRAHPRAPWVVAGVAVVLAIGLIDPMAWLLLVVLALAVLAGVVAARAHDASRWARHGEQLEAELRDTIAELRRSRARVAHVADMERRRIERDLHDGCQQRLIALRVKLSLAEEIMGKDNPPVHELIQEISDDAKIALEDLHALVHGIYPALLTDRGLADALKALARSAPLPARVQADGIRRYPPDVEAAVYFTCAEALQNAAKHGGPGTTARVVIRRESGGLTFEVRDDGSGFDTARLGGGGLAGMADRLGAVGGRLRIVSAPERGTTVQGWVPETALEL